MDDLTKALATLAKAQAATAVQVAWIKDRVGGTTKDGASLTSEIRALRS
ncbi:hypothetical protein [Microbacterium indicum]|nr:hypothetical protein [Microbacterium indicum]